MKHFRLTLAIAGMVLFTATANADPVNFTYSTSGSSLPSGVSFTGVTANSVATPQSGNLNNITLGTFSLANIGSSFWGIPIPGQTVGSFTLTVDFDVPAGVGGNPNTFSSTYTASANLLWTNADTLSVDFNANWANMSFNGADGSGTFQFRVDDIFLLRTSGTQTGTLRGDIRNATVTGGAVPEPQSVLLLLTAFAGLAFAAKKKFAA